MDSFHIILEITSSTLGMQKFFFVASQAHKKFNCLKRSTGKVEQFIEELDKILAADNDDEEMRSLFIGACFKSKHIFSCLYRLNLPKNVDVIDRVQDLTDDITNLSVKEAELVKELMNVRRKKKRKLKNTYINCLQISLSNIWLLIFLVFSFFCKIKIFRVGNF